jgi:hypothetical protein
MVTLEDYDVFYRIKQILHMEWTYELTNYSRLANKDSLMNEQLPLNIERDLLKMLGTKVCQHLEVFF